MHDSLIGQQLNNYRIDSVIGRGGMAIVYYGWDENLHRPVAVKVIDARYRNDPVYTERFVQEARAVASWRHDNILQVYYAGQQDDLYYFAMEFVDGLDLAQVLKHYAGETSLMPHEDVLEIGWAVARALDYAHKRGIIHRDVKPSNVMIGKDGRITLTDFGLAMNTQQGSFGGTFGSPQYIAPEQARNSAMVVPQSDLYALGVMLYEMLTGSVPFEDPSPTALAIQHLTQPPPPPRQVNPNLSEAVEEVLLKALNKQPADRYQSGALLMDALAAALTAPGPMFSPQAGTSNDIPGPALSQLSVAERVSMYMPPPPAGVAQSSSAGTGSSTAAPPLPSPSQPAPPSRNGIRFGVLGLAVVGVSLCLILGAGLVLFGSGLFANPDSTVSAGVEGTETETETAESLTATEPAVRTTVTETAAPGGTDGASTAVATGQTPPAQLTESPNQTATSAPATEPPNGETAVTPAGQRLVLFYNSTSFYVYNPNSEGRVRVGQMNFESLDANGQFSGYLFEGVRWAQFYSFLNPLNCVRLEVPPTGWLRPQQCRQYNATVTPEEDGDLIFWTPRENVTAFRVMWQGEEVGQCDVNTNQCEVFLP